MVRAEQSQAVELSLEMTVSSNRGTNSGYGEEAHKYAL